MKFPRKMAQVKYLRSYLKKRRLTRKDMFRLKRRYRKLQAEETMVAHKKSVIEILFRRHLGHSSGHDSYV